MTDRVAHETQAYAVYLNARHVVFDDPDEQRWFDEDLVKARAAMEAAWLDAKPVLER